MDRFEAARALGLADTEVLSAETTPDGTAVRIKDGGHRLINEDGVFALTDHPSTKQFRRWQGDGDVLLAEDDAAAEDSDPGQGEEQGESLEDVDDVPGGNADAVLDWVGDDQERATVALAVEVERDHPRSTLVSKLRKLAGQS